MSETEISETPLWSSSARIFGGPHLKDPWGRRTSGGSNRPDDVPHPTRKDLLHDRPLYLLRRRQTLQTKSRARTEEQVQNRLQALGPTRKPCTPLDLPEREKFSSNRPRDRTFVGRMSGSREKRKEITPDVTAVDLRWNRSPRTRTSHFRH